MSSVNDTNNESVLENTPSTAFGQYLTLQILMIVSLPCYFFVFYHLLTNSALHRAIQNHVIILLLTSNFIMVTVDMPNVLNRFRTDFLWPRTESFCISYLFIDYYLFEASLLVMVFASFESHILIFHKNLIYTRYKRILVHYVPMVICIGDPFICYVFTILLYPCSTYYDSTTESCIDEWYLSKNPILSIYDTIAHGIIPTFLVAISSVTLLIRVLKQK
jgi:hypothetical protein